jgi:hypothetical protein
MVNQKQKLNFNEKTVLKGLAMTEHIVLHVNPKYGKLQNAFRYSTRTGRMAEVVSVLA